MNLKKAIEREIERVKLSEQQERLRGIFTEEADRLKLKLKELYKIQRLVHNYMGER